ncbi:MAG: type II secretion system F family protein [Mobilitalea sp.]
MATYDYIYIDLKGKRKKGNMEVSDKDKLMSILKAEGKLLMKVSEQNLLNKDITLDFTKPVKSRDLAVFCRQLHSILTAGVTIINALDMLSNETENKALAKAIKETQRAIEKGESLGTAMIAAGNVFPPILIHMMEAGEVSGSIEVSLLRMSEHFEKAAKLKAIIKKATIYPIIVAVVSVLVILLMLVKVIPNFMNMFEDMDIKMPAMTMMVVHMSDFAGKYWFLLVAISALIFLGIKLFKKSEQGKEFFAKLELRLPLFGKLAIKTASASLGRTLSTLLAAGIPITQALELTAKSMDNLIFKQILIDTKGEAERGISIADTLKASGTFPPMACHLIRIGEQSGTTETMLVKVAEYYEEEVENTTESMMAVLEPMMIVILAVVVGFLLMAMFQPMLSMYKGLNNI